MSKRAALTIESPPEEIFASRKRRIHEILDVVLAQRQDDESYGDTEFRLHYRHGMPCSVEVVEKVTHKLD